MKKRSSYTVIETHGCRVIQRPIPITDLVALMKSWESLASEDDPWVCDAVLAQYFNAAIVVGPKSATSSWRAKLRLNPPA